MPVEPMQQIAEWLEKLGFGQYAQRFAENDIDPSVLHDLTDHDLEKIRIYLKLMIDGSHQNLLARRH
jgi:hypothetical protein